MKKTSAKIAYTLEHRLCKGQPGSCVTEDIWQKTFQFHAIDEKDAISKCKSWARYHSFGYDSVRPVLAKENETYFHDEWVS